MALEIRTLARADIPVMAAIYGEAVRTLTATFETDPPDVAEMTRRFELREAGGYPGVAAVVDGAVLGYAETRAYHHRAGYRFTVEDSIFLAPEARGQGVGSALLAELVGRAEARGFRQMIAVIGDAENVGSVALHRKAGFRLVGTTEAVGIKFGRWIGVTIMQRALGEGSTTLPPGV
jgi:L-amino acid N-acyltransferase YncA